LTRPRYCRRQAASNLAGSRGNAVDELTHDTGIGLHVATLDVSVFHDQLALSAAGDRLMLSV